MLKITKTASSLEEIKKIIDEISSYKTEKLKGLPKASYIEEYKNFSIYFDSQSQSYMAISENKKSGFSFSKKIGIIIILIISISGGTLYYLYNYTKVFWTQEQIAEEKELFRKIAMREKFPDFIKLTCDYYIKEVYVNGKQVKWYTSLGESETILIDRLGLSLEDDEIQIEFTQYSVNGFGHHLNETKKIDLAKLKRDSNDLKEILEKDGIVTQNYKIIP